VAASLDSSSWCWTSLLGVSRHLCIYHRKHKLTHASVEIFKSNRPVPNKVLWALVVFLFPVVGMLIYYLFSNRQAHNTYEPIPA
jgi:hypothetical protein